jgi:ABC-type cobalt transport system substrate-binding protein
MDKKIALYLLAIIVVVGFFILIAFLVLNPPKPDSTGVSFMLFGTLATAFGAVINYFFGSSQGSAEKTEMLAKAPPIPPKG